jgi:hypothetical protein
MLYSVLYKYSSQTLTNSLPMNTVVIHYMTVLADFHLYVVAYVVAYVVVSFSIDPGIVQARIEPWQNPIVSV